MLDEVMYAEKKTRFHDLYHDLDPYESYTTVAAHFGNALNAFYIPRANAISKYEIEL